MDNNFNNFSLLQLIFKWKWHILIITLVAALCGAIFSGPTFITPLYKSEAIAYPANTSPYSEEDRTEQMLQIISSKSIADSIIEKYDLWEDYDIDPSQPHAKSRMFLEYQNKIKITKTPYEAVSIVVNDKDPVTACNIANDILYYYDQKIRKLHRDKNAEVVVMFEKQLQEKQLVIDSLKRRMSELGSNYGITDVGNQSREVTRSWLSGSSKSTELKSNLERYGSELMDLQTKLAAEGNTFVAIKCDYERELRFYNGYMTYSNIITEPYPADQKSSPVRWIIVVFAGLGAFLISILTLFIIENRKRFLPADK
jgi:uncharacterized protein involved in exopolysaccharide biosynthesis